MANHQNQTNTSHSGKTSPRAASFVGFSFKMKTMNHPLFEETYFGYQRAQLRAARVRWLKNLALAAAGALVGVVWASL